MKIRLNEAPDGATGIVIDVLGGRGRIKKLLELGIVPGVRITIMKNHMAL